ncbi:MAG TPA: hypothetical protein VF169_06415 [Albitalea sp.]|uniref:hypothetical protein n=1 Tax=Piscinibacter sp. TaxID=1903157 RepID=UPI002ECFC899
MTTTRFLHRLLGAAALLAGFAAQAQTGPSYAVMSLVGDKITLVIHQMSTGSHLDANRRIETPMADDALDGVTAFAADDAIKRLQPSAKTSLFVTRDAKLFAMQDRSIDSNDGAVALAQATKDLAAASNATHLVLITKHRAETRLRMSQGDYGSGRLTGIGFYVDKETPVTDETTGHSTTGFLAPYAYLKVSVFDMASLRLLRQETSIATEVASATDSRTAAVAWDAMTAEQKFDALKRVVRKAIDNAMPKVLDPGR